MSTPAAALTDQFEVAGKVFNSRLIIGTGKYRTHDEMRIAHRASGAEMVTVAVRRVPLDRSSESFLDHSIRLYRFCRIRPAAIQLKKPCARRGSRARLCNRMDPS